MFFWSVKLLQHVSLSLQVCVWSFVQFIVCLGIQERLLRSSLSSSMIVMLVTNILALILDQSSKKEEKNCRTISCSVSLQTVDLALNTPRQIFYFILFFCPCRNHTNRTLVCLWWNSSNCENLLKC